MEELGGEFMNFIPDCGMEGMVCQHDDNLSLFYQNFGKEMQINYT